MSDIEDFVLVFTLIITFIVKIQLLLDELLPKVYIN